MASIDDDTYLKSQILFFADGWFIFEKLWKAILKYMPENGYIICYLPFFDALHFFRLNSLISLLLLLNNVYALITLVEFDLWCTGLDCLILPKTSTSTLKLACQQLNYQVIIHPRWTMIHCFCLVLPHPIVLFFITQSRQWLSIYLNIKTWRWAVEKTGDKRSQLTKHSRICGSATQFES